MKKLILLLYYFATLIMLYAEIEDEIYMLMDINKDFMGYYVSVDFIATLEETKNYNLTRELVLNKNDWYKEIYVHIIVDENKMWYYPFYSDLSFYVSKDSFGNFIFECINGDKIIIDPNGNKYKKITNDLENYEIVMNNFIGNIILSDFINTGEIIMENDFIIITPLNNRKLKISSWFYYDDPAINLRLYNYEFGNKWRVFLKINNQKLIIYYDPPIWHRGERFDIILEMDK
jgi:hypothetical protein